MAASSMQSPNSAVKFCTQSVDKIVRKLKFDCQVHWFISFFCYWLKIRQPVQIPCFQPQNGPDGALFHGADSSAQKMWIRLCASASTPWQCLDSKRIFFNAQKKGTKIKVLSGGQFIPKRKRFSQFCTFSVDKIVRKTQPLVLCCWFVRLFLQRLKSWQPSARLPLPAKRETCGSSAHFLWIRLCARPCMAY